MVSSTILYGWLYLSPVTRHDKNTTDTVSNFRCKPTCLKVFGYILTLLLDLGVSHGPLLDNVNKQDGGRMWQIYKNTFSSNITASRSWRL